jgi:predicted GTPase
MERKRLLVMGAAGRDFHDFNVLWRNDPSVEVVAFTATQIPGIAHRRYPAELAGPLYPEGIPIVPESELEELCDRERIDRVVFAYSDILHADVMHAASRALAAGADFELPGPRRSMLRANRPVIAVSALRTGCGKSQTARWLGARLRERGLRVAALRHPMPYGDLARQAVQRFETRADLIDADCTAEEREEYEPWIEQGSVIFAGVDYEPILRRAEGEADVIVWDGGNNDFPFVAPDLHIVVADALRPDQVTTHHPGEVVARSADVFVVNKVDAATPGEVQRLEDALRAVRPEATIVRARSPVRLDAPERVRGRRVLVVDDGPSLTHGGMPYGAGWVAAVDAGAAEIIDPRASATPSVAQVYERFPHLQRVLPALGYGPEQLAALRETIDTSEAEVVVSGSPIDLATAAGLSKPVVRARYHFEEASDPGLWQLVENFLAEHLGQETSCSS